MIIYRGYKEVQGVTIEEELKQQKERNQFLCDELHRLIGMVEAYEKVVSILISKTGKGDG